MSLIKSLICAPKCIYVRGRSYKCIVVSYEIFLEENTFFLKIFCHKFENIFVIKCKKIEIKKVKFINF